MSFMHLTCPWCGAEYTFGIVGRQMIGSGHPPNCKRVECEEPGCSEPGIFYVCDDPNSEWRSFRCRAHTGSHAALMAQSSRARVDG